MAVDQREALIAAVRAQVEKERAEKQKKLEREQEAMAFAKKKSGGKQEEGQKKYKTLSPKELARIEEKKRRKRAEELGAGIRLQSISEDDILDSLKQVLSNPDYKKNAVKVSDSFRACGGAAEARAFLEEVAGR